jgi:CRP-like cAMP-binding protein
MGASKMGIALDTFSSPTRLMFRNRLLQMLPAEELRRLRPHLARVRLAGGDILHRAGGQVEQAYFVEQGYVSMVAETAGAGSRVEVEVGLIGRESVVGSSVLLAADPASSLQAMVQVPGTAYCIRADILHATLEHAPALRRAMRQALETLVAQLAQIAACNSRHTLPERLARWLLMAHDRMDDDELPLTQDVLAAMLAVRRPGVTIAIGTLQTAGLLRHSRGRIVICDRPGLEATACSCYGQLCHFVAKLANLVP